MRKLNKLHYIEMVLVGILILWLIVFSIPHFKETQVRQEIVNINQLMYTFMEKITHNPALWLREYHQLRNSDELDEELNINRGTVAGINTEEINKIFPFTKAFAVEQRLFYVEHGSFKDPIEEFENSPIQPPNYFLIYTPRNKESDLTQDTYFFDQSDGQIPENLKFHPSNGLTSRGFLSVHSDQILNATDSE